MTLTESISTSSEMSVPTISEEFEKPGQDEWSSKLSQLRQITPFVSVSEDGELMELWPDLRRNIAMAIFSAHKKRLELAQGAVQTLAEFGSHLERVDKTKSENEGAVDTETTLTEVCKNIAINDLSSRARTRDADELRVCCDTLPGYIYIKKLSLVLGQLIDMYTSCQSTVQSRNKQEMRLGRSKLWHRRKQSLVKGKTSSLRILTTLDPNSDLETESPTRGVGTKTQDTNIDINGSEPASTAAMAHNGDRRNKGIRSIDDPKDDLLFGGDATGTTWEEFSTNDEWHIYDAWQAHATARRREI
ncbi:hypothetical protein F5Y15DRAFT_413552 [Xylariaceae sp. FL0016]|nr:hypothetical protein F5Y15DRAFT_413552 [Xylariaceae sp. FL0016]